jgi:peroxidase
VNKIFIFWLLEGDFRTDENIGLAAHQTIWVREHNRIADALKATHPAWDDETVFQEARRITIAEYQHIIFNEFLPPLVGITFLSLTYT